MARSAADAGLLLTAMAGTDQHDPVTQAGLPVPRRGYPTRPAKGRRPFAGMRFGVAASEVDELPASLGRLFDRFEREMEQLGARLVRVQLPAAPLSIKTLAGDLGEVGVYHSQFVDRSGRYDPVIQSLVTASIAASRARGMGDYVRLNQERVAFQHRYNEMFTQHSLTALLLPAVNVDGAARLAFAGVTTFSGGPIGEVGFANATGVPVLTTPVGRSSLRASPSACRSRAGRGRRSS